MADEAPPGILRDLLWVEKYRPTSLDGLAVEDGTRKLLQSYVEAEEFPHLLLVGPPGTGKTTVARILHRAVDCRVLALNASSERGIDVVRGKIAAFVQAMTSARWQVVFLDEADAMTPDAQTALRNLIEAYTDRARFVLTANYLHKIIAPIQSRCLLVELTRPPIKERYRILFEVLQAEGIAATPQVILSYAERFPDLRKMLMSAQRAYLSTGELPTAHGMDGAVAGGDMLAMIKGKNWTALKTLTRDVTFEPGHALRDLFWAIPDEDPSVGFLRHTVGKAVHESAYTPDPIIHFLGTCAEVMEGL